MHTFKKPNKTTGTAYSSDGETANTTTPSISSAPILNNDDKTEIETISNELSLTIDDKKRINNTNVSPQQLNESSHFDPLISTDNSNLQELETLLKSTFQKSISNDESITISSTNDDISDLKLMMMDLSKRLLNKMNIIETKIDDHCIQTRKLNHILTNTILPSLIDLTDIIQETSSTNLDSHSKIKLENIQTRIRTTQQQQQTEMKDLMDI